jgi:prolyl-tRNA synthetase
MLRMSTLFLRTLREDPAEAEVPSHRLLIRAGYLRRAAPGGYTWLPLGKLVLDNVARIIREEMAAIGGQEVAFPTLLPREPYERSGRWNDYGPDMFRLRDRRGADYLLAPTHEEMFTLLVKDLYASYKDYPVILYQLQTKFRDEPRPRGGVLRGREFLMKDSYSFDVDESGLAESYRKHRDAYTRIFARLGLDVVAVSATAGAMGGSTSEEFLTPSPVGEDSFVSCGQCGYAANVEAAETARVPAQSTVDVAAMEVVDTPDTPTIDTLVDRLNEIAAAGRRDWTAADTLKNVVVTVTPPGADGEPVAIGVPGDRELDLKRVEATLYPATVTMFDDFASRPDLARGYIGPQNLRLRYLADPRIAPGTAWATGAGEVGRHAVNVVCGRDFIPDGTIEAAEVLEGDPCPRCGAGLRVRRGIEVGHVFQLGRRYADAFGLDALGPDGKRVRITMGSYGIGVSRAVAAIAEAHHDERGLAWPSTVAPCDVHLVPAGGRQQLEAARDLAAELSAGGVRVLLDDRPGLSAGVRFADAELLGMPNIVVVGRRLRDGYVELRDRASGATRDIAVTELAGILTRTTYPGPGGAD